MKTLRVLFATIITLMMSTTQAEGLLFDKLSASDKEIVKDLARIGIKGQFDGQQCFKHKGCDDVFSGWIYAYTSEKDGAKLAGALNGAPPHMRNQIALEAFKKRYAELSSRINPADICYQTDFIGIEFLERQNAYKFRVGNFALTDYYSAFQHENGTSNSYFVISYNDKLLRQIASSQVTSDEYKTYTNIPNGSAVVKICGKLVSSFDLGEEPSGIPPNFTVIAISKPVEIISKRSLKVVATIPEKWFTKQVKTNRNWRIQ